VVFGIKRLKTTESKKQVKVNQAIDGVIQLFTGGECSLYSQSQTGAIDFKSGTNLEYTFKTIVAAALPPCSLLISLVENKDSTERLLESLSPLQHCLLLDLSSD
jgi:hypothetical protein